MPYQVNSFFLLAYEGDWFLARMGNGEAGDILFKKIECILISQKCNYQKFPGENDDSWTLFMLK